MRIHYAVLGFVALAATPPAVSAQGIELVRTAVLYESYSFDDDPALTLDRVAALTVPVGIDLALGRFGTVTLSSGFAMVDLTGRAGQADQSLSGVLDTEIRLGINVIPGSLVLLVTGGIPTGIKTIDPAEQPLLGSLVSNVIGFASPSLGTGGSVGGGLVGAVPLGQFALGLGATYKLPFSYTPVTNGQELSPGGEFRLRAGLEGPLARQTYLRVAGVFSVRSKDELGPTTLAGIGNRIVGYLSVNQGFGNAQVNLYAFDVYRGGPRIDPTVAGPALLFKGNLFAAGARLAIPVGRNTEIAPRGEYRVSTEAQSLTDDRLLKVGNSYRVGFDLTQTVSPAVTLVVQGSGLFGDVRPRGVGQPGPLTDVGISGFRGALHLRITPP